MIQGSMKDPQWSHLRTSSSSCVMITSRHDGYSKTLEFLSRSELLQHLRDAYLNQVKNMISIPQRLNQIEVDMLQLIFSLKLRGLVCPWQCFIFCDISSKGYLLYLEIYLHAFTPQPLLIM